MDVAIARCLHGDFVTKRCLLALLTVRPGRPRGCCWFSFRSQLCALSSAYSLSRLDPQMFFVKNSLNPSFHDSRLSLRGVGIHSQLFLSKSLPICGTNHNPQKASCAHDYANYDSATKENAQVTIPGYLAIWMALVDWSGAKNN